MMGLTPITHILESCLKYQDSALFTSGILYQGFYKTTFTIQFKGKIILQ